MAKTLFILNDPPYGTERSYNALREEHFDFLTLRAWTKTTPDDDEAD